MSQQEFEHYLALLARMLKLTPSQRDAIADELRTHLEERLDELQQQGHDREQAITLALDEFGDANALAADFTDTLTQARRTRTRRRLMQTTAGTLIAAAAVTFVVMTLTPSNFQGTPTQAPAVAQQTAPPGDRLTPYVDQCSTELRILLIDEADADALREQAEPIDLPGLTEAVRLSAEQVQDWMRVPSSHIVQAPRVTTWIGQRAAIMTATSVSEQLPVPKDAPPVVSQTSRGVSVGLLVLPAPHSNRLRLSLDLQTVWSTPQGDEPHPNFHPQTFGQLQPALPVGHGWSPGLTGLRFQLEIEPQARLAIKLPTQEAHLGLTDANENREVWLFLHATPIPATTIQDTAEG